MCLKRKAWDELLDRELLKQWNNLRLEIMAIKHAQFPRYYFNTDKKPFLCQLHGFCDASTKAYVTVIYLRTVRDDYNGLTSDIFRPFYSMSDHLYIVFLMQCMDVRSN